MITFSVGDRIRCRDRMSPMKIDVVGSKWTATWPDFAGLVKSIDGRKGLVVVERATGVLQTINVGQGDVLEKLELPALTDPQEAP